MNWLLIQKVLLPETFLLIGILLALVLSFTSKARYIFASSAFALAAACVILLQELLPRILDQAAVFSMPINIIANSFVHDSLSIFFRLLIYFVTMLICLASSKYLKVLESPAEYYAVLLTAALGAGCLSAVNDLLAFFVALETLGLSSILLSSYARKSPGSNEAGIKYLINSAVATAILLFGISMVYGLTASTNFTSISAILSEFNALGIISMPLQILVATLFVASIAFKLAAAPFHNWSPDVYTGAPTTTTLFLSVASKAAAFALAIRLFVTVLHNFEWVYYLLATIAILSIIVGNYIGVVQVISRSSIKRLMAYSSIAQAGYLIIGLAILQKESLSALVFYLFVYALMNTGAFLAVIYFEQELNTQGKMHNSEIYDLAGFITKRPLITIAFALCLINLAGLPFIPAGFIAKFFLFSAAYSSGLSYGPLLAVVGLLGSIVGLFYYLYVIKIMVVDSPSLTVQSMTVKPLTETKYLSIALTIVVMGMTIVGFVNTGFYQKMASAVINGIG